MARTELLMDEPPTRFELLTAAAFTWFADEAVDVAVVEVGMGGTWDCTNIVHGIVSVVTNISFDHTEVLGPTLEDIARDKAGIFKSGGRAVVGETDPTLVALFRAAADAAGCQEFWAGYEFACTSNGWRSVAGWSTCGPRAAYGELLIPLHGSHQGDNAACASPRPRRSSARPSPRTWWKRAGCSSCAGTTRGHRAPPAGHRRWGPQRRRDECSRPLADRGVRHRGETTAIVACSRDGTRRPCWTPWFGRRPFDHRLCTDSPRAIPAVEVAAAAAKLGMEVSLASSPAEAVRQAVERSSPEDRVVVCGSLYVVADAREALLPRTI